MPCQQLSYHTSISAAPFSKMILESQVRTSKGKYDVTDLQENFSRLDIFFSDLSYSHVEAFKAYPILSCLCDIGGAMGLLLGSTALTIVEFLDFLTGSAFLIMRNAGKR